MILPCPACQARFMVPDDRITPKGIKIRCPKCRFVFIMRAQPRGAGTASSEGAATASASGSIGGAAPAVQRKRRAPEEGEARRVSAAELAALDQEEIVDMDDLAQATEQSGTAFNPNVKEEHFQPQATGGPSVLIDDSLLAAAAVHKASWTEEPTAPEHIPRIDPSLTVSDTWVDLPGAAPALEDVDRVSAPPAGVERVTASTEPPLTAADQESLQTDVSALKEAETGADGVPAGDQPAAATPAAGGSVLQSVLPAAAPQAQDDDFDVDLEEEDLAKVAAEPPSAPPPAVASGGRSFQMAYTLTAASSIAADELANLDEYEGLLVEEKRALRKGPAAMIIAVIGIVGGLAVIGTLGLLGWQALHPPEKKLPSWGHLELFGLDQQVMGAGGGKQVIRVSVKVRNASKDKRFENVHVAARLVSPTGEVKCRSWAPCGPVLSDREIARATRKGYHETVAKKARGTPYNVELAGGQQQQCQVLLFCAERYQVGRDRVHVEIDKKRTHRLME